MAHQEGKVELEVVTPVKMMFRGDADMVVVPGGSGDFGVLPGHAPLQSTLRPGTVDIYKGDKVENQIFVEGGFAEVTEERCTLLAQEAQLVREVHQHDAEDRVDRARNTLEAADSFEHRKAAGRELEAAEAMLAAVKKFQESAGR